MSEIINFKKKIKYMATSKSFLRLTMLALTATFILSMVSCGGDDPNKPDCTECPECPGCSDDPGITDEFGVSLTEIRFNGDEDASLIVVRTKGKWTASASATWVQLSAKSGDGNTGFLVAAGANSGLPRSATLTISAGSNTKQIPVTQDGH